MMTKKDFEQLYNDFFDEIFHFFFYSLLNRAEAEDLTSITFFKFYLNMDKYDDKKSLPRTYLWAIARNVLNDYYRTSYEQINIEDIDLDMKKEENFDDRLILLEILSALSQKERQILYYKYYLDMTAREISEITDLSVTNVTSICSRALAKARKLYKNI